MSEAEEEMYKLLFWSGNVPAIPFEMCRKTSDMFNAIVQKGYNRYAVLKIGEQVCFLDVELSVPTALGLIKSYFLEYADPPSSLFH